MRAYRSAPILDGARRRLDRLSELLPEQKEELPFEEYMARASMWAARDADFRRQLMRSIVQYGTVQGGMHGRSH